MKKKNIFLVGDSTMQSYGSEYAPQEGWGAYFYKGFKEAEKCRIFHPEECFYEQTVCYDMPRFVIWNYAMAGRSSRSFREEGRLSYIEERMGMGDYMLIQFGHNDAAEEKAERYVRVQDFGESLSYYSEVCRSKKAIPIFLTPLAMRSCVTKKGQAYSFPEYRNEMLKYAEYQGLPILDLGGVSAGYVSHIGQEESKKLYLWVEEGKYEGRHKDGAQDNAHLCYNGAEIFAGMVTELIRKKVDSRLMSLQNLIL